MIAEHAANQFGRQIRDCNRVGGEQQPSLNTQKAANRWASPLAYAMTLPKGSLDISTSQYDGGRTVGSQCVAAPDSSSLSARPLIAGSIGRDGTGKSTLA